MAIIGRFPRMRPCHPLVSETGARPGDERPAGDAGMPFDLLRSDRADPGEGTGHSTPLLFQRNCDVNPRTRSEAGMNPQPAAEQFDAFLHADEAQLIAESNTVRVDW